METVNIHHAKTHLSQLIKQVEAGGEFIISRAGKPIARVVPVEETPKKRELGKMKGQIWMSEDFDAYDEEIARMFGMLEE
jgi:prevent-host-death family protein